MVNSGLFQLIGSMSALGGKADIQQLSQIYLVDPYKYLLLQFLLKNDKMQSP